MFIVSLPDVDGNPRYPPTVIAVEDLDEWRYRVLGPPSFAARWQSLDRRLPWMQTAGPARELTRADWCALVGWHDETEALP